MASASAAFYFFFLLFSHANHKSTPIVRRSMPCEASSNRTPTPSSVEREMITSNDYVRHASVLACLTWENPLREINCCLHAKRPNKSCKSHRVTHKTNFRAREWSEGQRFKCGFVWKSPSALFADCGPSSCLIYIVYHQRFIVIGAPAWVHRGGERSLFRAM